MGPGAGVKVSATVCRGPGGVGCLQTRSCGSWPGGQTAKFGLFCAEEGKVGLLGSPLEKVVSAAALLAGRVKPRPLPNQTSVVRRELSPRPSASCLRDFS